MGYSKEDFEGSTSFLTGNELELHNKSEGAHPYLLGLLERYLEEIGSAELKENKNKLGGYAGLDGNGKIPPEMLSQITSNLLGDGAVTKQKLAEEILKELENFVKKDGSKVLSDVNYTKDKDEAVQKIAGILKDIYNLQIGSASKNQLASHVQNTDVHVTRAERDGFLKEAKELVASAQGSADAAKVSEENAAKSEAESKDILDYVAEKTSEASGWAESANFEYTRAQAAADKAESAREGAEENAQMAQEHALVAEDFARKTKLCANAVTKTTDGEGNVTINDISPLAHNIKLSIRPTKAGISGGKVKVFIDGVYFYDFTGIQETFNIMWDGYEGGARKISFTSENVIYHITVTYNADTNAVVGNIETALDAIISMQNELIGGGSE